jgi:DNA polymerase-3 subunit epsilon
MLECISKIDLHACKMVDVQTIYHHMEPRNLRAAYRFYCGGVDFENAHTAEADTLATYEVLKAQLDRYKEPSEVQQEALKNDVDALSKVGGRARSVDFAGRLYLNDDGEPTVSFGKHKGRTAREVWESEPAYFAWIENGDFTLDTKRQFARLKQQFQEERKKALDRPATDDELAGLRSKFNSGKLF